MKYFWRLYYRIVGNPGTFSGAFLRTARINGLKVDVIKPSKVDAKEFLGKADYVSKD